jgi:hypothetical protein
VSRCLALTRVLALVGGLALLAAFFMPWFASQGLLLSGQFLDSFLSSANPAEVQRFLPSSSPSEVILLRALVDLFAVCGVIAAAASVTGGLAPRTRPITNLLLGLSGLVPLIAWAIGIGRLPPGSTPEIGLWLIVAGALAILIGLALELRPSRPRLESSQS